MALPSAVRKQGERAAALIAGKDSAAPANTDTPGGIAPSAPANAGTPNEGSWEQRYKVLKGKYDAEVPALHEELSDIKRQLGAALQRIDELSRAPQGARSAQSGDGAANSGGEPEVKLEELTQEEIDRYGADLINVIKKVSTAASPAPTKLAHQPAAVAFYAQLDDGLPNWRAVNVDPAFIKWLSAPFGTTSFTRHQVLTSAAQSFNAVTALEIFRAYLKEIGRAAPSISGDEVTLPPSGGSGEPVDPGAAEVPTISTREINEFYNDVRRGKYRGKEADRQRMEQRINGAVLAGRVVATKK